MTETVATWFSFNTKKFTFSDYEAKAQAFAIYPEAGDGSKLALAYTSLGLVGEAGEFSEKVKKFIRGQELDIDLAAKELGDVLWYITACANELGYTLGDIADMNLKKLSDRKARGVIKSEGDTR